MLPLPAHPCSQNVRSFIGSRTRTAWESDRRNTHHKLTPLADRAGHPQRQAAGEGQPQAFEAQEGGQEVDALSVVQGAPGAE